MSKSTDVSLLTLKIKKKKILPLQFKGVQEVHKMRISLGFAILRQGRILHPLLPEHKTQHSIHQNSREQSYMIPLSFYPLHQLAARQFVDAGTMLFTQVKISSWATLRDSLNILQWWKAHGGAAGWDISLQAGRSWVWLTESFQLRCGLGVNSASNKHEYEDYLLGVQGDECTGLTILLASCADFLEMWEPWGLSRPACSIDGYGKYTINSE